MRKNKMMRFASGLLVATLLTTCIISGTFAKYVTKDSGQDSARVAKWGVKVTATGNDAFAKQYNSDTQSVTANTVVSADANKVVAPGTKGILLTYNISGTPEVMVNVKVDADLQLNNWTINTNETYCPIIFKVKRGDDAEVEYKLGTTTNTDSHVYATTAELETAIEGAVKAMAENNTNAGQDLKDAIEVTWEWPYAASSYQTDEKDTALGNAAADNTAPTISMNSSVTVEQVD